MQIPSYFHDLSTKMVKVLPSYVPLIYKIMESSNSKKNVPQLWYWSQPENGFSFEDAETIAKEFVFEAREDKSGDRFLHIAFV